MAAVQLIKVIERLRNVVADPDVSGMADGDLMKRYVRQRDQQAFEALVRRHGPMVMGVCCRVLHNEHDAEDAFQATFLLLARKAATLRSPGTVGNWLYGVAYRTALEAKRATAKRRAKEASVVIRDKASEDIWTELRPVLDQELDRLPEKYRAVVVLCDLEGKTRKEAARHLGWPEGTVASRLATARKILAKKLAGHGFAVSGGALAATLSQNASACVSPLVVSSTIKAAGLVTAGKAAPAAAISPKVAALMEGVMKTMFLTKLKIATAVLVAVALVAGGIGAVSFPALQGEERPDLSKAQFQPVVKTDLERLHGAWTLVAMETRGKKLTGKDMTYGGAPLKSLKLVIDGKNIPKLRKIPADQVTDPNDRLGGVDVQFGDNEPAKGGFLLNETKKPKQISMAWFLMYWESIYKVEGDTLTICFNPKNCIRPDEFRTSADSDRVLFVCQRAPVHLKEKGDKAPAAEEPVKAPQKEEKEGFTAWGKEVGGLQAGLGYHPGQKRAYSHGETVKLVVRVRNVGKQEVKFQYLHQFFTENPPAVTDGAGKPVTLPRIRAFGFHGPVEVNLAPGKEIELYELKLELRPASESSNRGSRTIYGTGKFQIQYERVFGNSSAGTIKLDPDLSKLATGKLELEIKSAAPAPKQARPATDPPKTSEKPVPEDGAKPTTDPPKKGKPADAKDILVKAVKAGQDIKVQDDEARRQKVDFLVMLAYSQQKAGDRASADTTFTEALTVAGMITDSEKRADAQSHIGFYQAHAGFVKEAAKTAKGIAIKDGKLKGDALKHRVETLQGHVLAEIAAHLASTGKYNEALATAETIPVRVLRFKTKDKDKFMEKRDTAKRDLAYQHIAKAQLKAGKTGEAFKTLAKIEVWRSEVFLYQDILLAHGKGKDLATVRKLVAAFQKEMEKREVSAATRHHVLADVQGALGDAAGALEWIEKLDSPQARAEALMGLSIGLSRAEAKK